MIRVISFLSSPKIFLGTIFWLMILVVLGTLAQANIGLYESQQKYFSSWIMWFWYIPVPGGRLTLLIMFINLFAFILKPSFWSFKKIGIIVIHCGVLLLLIGGGMTAWFSSEGMMAIDEGKKSNFIFSPYDKELVIANTSNPDYDSVIVINDELLEKKGIIQSPELPFTIKVLDYFINSTAIFRDTDKASDWWGHWFTKYPPDLNYKGLAERFSLLKLNNEKERELNYTGIIFEIFNSSDSSVNGIYFLMLEQPVQQTININGQDLILSLRRERTYLPFSLELIDFKKEMHPGTDIAKSFSSNVSLHDRNIDRSVIIEMNVPLRYRNHTFYQSAFRENQDFDTTILSVVKNYGRLFPYISTIIMSLGLLLHMILRLPNLFSERKKRAK